jgi:hypothetical protein
MFCVGDSRTLLGPFSIIWRISGYFIFCGRKEPPSDLRVVLMLLSIRKGVGGEGTG